MDPISIGIIAGGGLLLSQLLKKGGDSSSLSGSPRVLNRERANGVHPLLQQFLDQWEVNGPFVIMVGVDGGVRTDASKQLDYYNKGTSKAQTLDATAHGRGGAIDVWPVIDGEPRFDWEQPGPVRDMYYQLGAIGRDAGLVWGGVWGDGPHLEYPSWKNLPYPPNAVGV